MEAFLIMGNLKNCNECVYSTPTASNPAVCYCDLTGVWRMRN